jgi:hypothetical protein
MPYEDNTANNAEHPLDTEDWLIAFEPYLGHPFEALALGFSLMVLKKYISVEPFKLQEASDGLDRAMEVLFPFTEFHQVTYGLFVRLASGKLSLEEEDVLRALGVKF